MIGRKRNTIVVKKEAQVLSLYKTGLTQKQVANKIGISSSSVFNILKSSNASRRMTSYRKHTLDENYFSDIDTEAKAFLLGFIYADGCLRVNPDRKRYSLSIVIHKQDRYILDLIKKELKCTYNIIPEKKLYLRITINSEKLLNDLMSYGLKQNKVHSLVFPHIKKPYIKDFIRGYFDGDGSIFKDGKHLRVTFSGHLPFLKKLSEHLPVETRWVIDKRTEKHGSIRINKQKDIITLGKYMYQGKKYFLLRKYNKWGVLS